MLERLKRTGALNFVSQVETMDTVFNYFAGQVFNDLAPAARDVLVRTGFLPHVTVKMAKAISGNAGADKVLDDLYRRHLFTSRRTGEELTYHYHALFQAFLKAQAGQLLSPDEYHRLHDRAARFMPRRDRRRLALPRTEAWSTGANSQVASTLISKADDKRLQLIAALPSDFLETVPGCSLARDVYRTEPKEGRRNARGRTGIRRTTGQARTGAGDRGNHRNLRHRFGSVCGRMDHGAQRFSPIRRIFLRLTSRCASTPPSSWGRSTHPAHPLLHTCVQRIDAIR
jgi:hypothetical protein